MKIKNINIKATLEKARQLIDEDTQISAATRSIVEILILIITLLANRLNLDSSNSSKPPSNDPNRKKRTSRKAVASQGGTPGYQDSDRTLAPSTIHRWVTGLSGLVDTCRTALSLLLQDNPVSSVCRDIAQIVVPSRKYRSEHRKNHLIRVLKLMMIAAFFRDTFKTSIFTKLAIACAFT